MVMISGHGDMVAINTMRLDDYISKPPDLNRLNTVRNV
jgi:hypothetical protein